MNEDLEQAREAARDLRDRWAADPCMLPIQKLLILAILSARASEAEKCGRYSRADDLRKLAGSL